MGSGQSQPQPEVVRIERNEIPEEYKSVGVSSEVVKRVQEQGNQSGSSNADSDRLRSELQKEREEKQKLREEMARLTDLQQRQVNGVAASAPTATVGSDIEERKRVFQETVDRVQEQFFGYHRENVCQGHEEEIMSCLKSNPGRVLKCSPLAESYENCVGEFRQKVLKGK